MDRKKYIFVFNKTYTSIKKFVEMYKMDDMSMSLSKPQHEHRKNN